MNTRGLMVPKHGLTLQDQIELGKRMVVLNDKDAREALILNCVPMVKSLARTFSNNHHPEYDDMFQDGMLGVLEAIDKYDYTRNVMFTSYSYRFILRKITTGIRKQMPVKITERDYIYSSLINSTIKTYVSIFQKEPSNKELAELLNIPLETIAVLRPFNPTSVSTSYEDYIINNSGAASKLPNGDVAILIERAALTQSHRPLLYQALEVLTECEKEIIQERYLSANKKTLKELSEQQDVTITSIAKREKKALKKMFAYFVSNNMFFEDLVS